MKDLDNIKSNLVNNRKILEERLSRIQISKRKQYDLDSEEQSIQRENDDVVDALGENIIRELEQINNALKRIEEGNYGECRVCGELIQEKRLEALPYTDICISCAEQY